LRKRLSNLYLLCFMSKRIITLKELAKKLGFSISTISRALNDHPDISENTKSLVQNLAKSLHYEPNLIAKGFRKSKLNIIGVIVPNVTVYYTSTVLKGIIEQAEKDGYRVIITETKNDIQKQTEILHVLIQFGVDGILMSLSKNSNDIDEIYKIVNTIPLVLFDKVSSRIPCTKIVINEEEASYNAVKHLINIGKKRIAIIKETEFSYVSNKRYNGYLNALKKHNLRIDQSLILSCDDLTLKKGQELTKTLLDNDPLPDAIFTITDNAAVGTIQVLKKHGIVIPDEIAVIGYSNSLVSRVIEPSLTTVDQPGKRMGHTAVSYLLEEIEKKEYEMINRTVEIKTNLIIRKSTVNKQPKN